VGSLGGGGHARPRTQDRLPQKRPVVGSVGHHDSSSCSAKPPHSTPSALVPHCRPRPSTHNPSCSSVNSLLNALTDSCDNNNTHNDGGGHIESDQLKSAPPSDYYDSNPVRPPLEEEMCSSALSRNTAHSPFASPVNVCQPPLIQALSVVLSMFARLAVLLHSHHHDHHPRIPQCDAAAIVDLASLSPNLLQHAVLSSSSSPRLASYSASPSMAAFIDIHPR
jgi:hypothetical protein